MVSQDVVHITGKGQEEDVSPEPVNKIVLLGEKASWMEQGILPNLFARVLQIRLFGGNIHYLFFRKVSNMKANPQLKAMIIEVVDNQLKANDPLETGSTLERLIAEGYSEKEQRNLSAVWLHRKFSMS